ncbi:MAG: tetratricopeptide repeat protein [Thermodesulfobacteriota bacterium]
MKRCFTDIFLTFILFCFVTACTQLNQHSLDSQPMQKKSVKEEEHLSANYFYLESRIHIKNKKFNKAIESLQKAVDRDTASFILTRDLVQLYLKQNNNEKAYKLAENFAQQNPENVDGLLLLIQLNKDTMDEKEVVAILNKVLLLDPKNKETFLRLGKIYIEEKRDAEALSLFKEMVKQFPDYYVSWFYLGEVYLAQKQYKLAEIQFLKTIELEPALAEPRFQLIELYKIINFSKNQDKILQAYQKILELEPGNHRAQLGMGLYYYKINMKKKAANLFMKLGREVESGSRLIMVAVDEYITRKKYQDAVIVFSQMLKGYPDNSTLNFFTAMSYEAVNNFQKAIFYYLKIEPDYSQYKKTILNITYLYKELGQDQTALQFLEGKHEELPEDIDIIIYLASFYEKEKKYEKAVKLLQKGLENSPENTSLLFRLGAIQDKAGFKEESLNSMKKIIKIDPEDASALNYLGYSYADQGILLDEALILIKKANKIKPDDGYITDSLGWVYYKMGDYKKAVEILEKAAELTSFETIISDHLGDAYLKADQLNKALNTYQKALSNATDKDKKIVLELKEKIDAVKKKINE